MKKLTISVIALLILPAVLFAGFNFGLINAAKKTVDKVDEKVKVKKAEIVAASHRPAISLVSASPATISTGAVSSISCAASTPAGDTLSYVWSAASGSISGTGATINWTAPASSGTYAINVTVSYPQGESAQGGTNVAVTKLNNPPVISSLVANPEIVSTGVVSAVSCAASDADGDTLTYLWSAASGTIVGTGSTINWTAPLASSTYRIDVTVSDANGGSTQLGVNVPVIAASNHQLPDTGQTLSYTTTFGEDHDYQPVTAQLSYTDNGDGTTTDNRTGLMWAKDGNSGGCNNGVSLTWESALNFCEGLTFAAYSDWRMPNVRELESIVNAGNSSPAISSVFFSNTKNVYWSSTTAEIYGNKTWYVDYSDGSVYGVLDKTGSNYVRCVRAGP